MNFVLRIRDDANEDELFIVIVCFNFNRLSFLHSLSQFLRHCLSIFGNFYINKLLPPYVSLTLPQILQSDTFLFSTFFILMGTISQIILNVTIILLQVSQHNIHRLQINRQSYLWTFIHFLELSQLIYSKHYRKISIMKMLIFESHFAYLHVLSVYSFVTLVLLMDLLWS